MRLLLSRRLGRRFGEQRADGSFSTTVVTLADLRVANLAGAIDEVHGRPVPVSVCVPSDEVVVQSVRRLVDLYARRLQLQERLTSQIAERLGDAIDSRGVVVVTESEHLCMTIRGVQKLGSYARTRVVRGVFREKAEARAEALDRLRAR
jgi:hypothetical protein